MSACYIWVFEQNDDSAMFASVGIEIFVGRNKYTQAGLFSGPLRRPALDSSCNDNNLQYLLSLHGVSQVGKNRYRLAVTSVGSLFSYFQQEDMDTAFYRMEDRKLHHIKKFSHMQCDGEHPFFYNSKIGEVTYYINKDAIDNTPHVLQHKMEPAVRLYCIPEKDAIRLYVNFVYGDIEIGSNSDRESFTVQNKLYYRDLQFEGSVLKFLLSTGGKSSYRNEIVFAKKLFFNSAFYTLNQQEYGLFWGLEKKQIAKSQFSCSVSYHTDWFHIEGTVEFGDETLSLSQLLKASRGKRYVEIQDKIHMIPDEFIKVAHHTHSNAHIQVPVREMMPVFNLAQKFAPNDFKYLEDINRYEDTQPIMDIQLRQLLKSYQFSGIQWMLTLYQNQLGCCLSDDMGLGKTLQTIGFLACQQRDITKPTLIVVPKIVLYNWEHEFQKFAPFMDVIVVYGKYDYTTLGSIDTGGIFLTTYDTLLNHLDEFSAVAYDSVILDEAQYVKNYRTQRHRAFAQIIRRFTLCLSGTPVENNLEELWSLSNLLNPGLLGQRSGFIRKFTNEDGVLQNVASLRRLISPFFLRRTKEQVLKELPAKTESYIYCEMEESQREIYDSFMCATKKDLSEKPSRYTIKDNSAILQALLYLREICVDPQLLPPDIRGQCSSASCKFDLFQEYATNIMNESGKLIVYSQFPRTLRKLEYWSKSVGWNTYFIDGTVNDRESVVCAFEQAEQGVFFISLKAGGVGLNLTSCQYVILYEPWWNSAAEEQASNRVYRIGQENPVFIYHFLVRNTIEEKVYELQRKKQDLFTQIMERLDQPSSISIDDLYNILM